MEIKKDFKKLEEKVMKMLLKGDHPTLRTLYKQWENSEIEDLDLTGVGFFIKYKISDKSLVLPGTPSFPFGDVLVYFGGSKYPAGFALFIENGYLEALEGYAYDTIWPEKIEIKRIYYQGDSERNWEELSRKLK